MGDQLPYIDLGSGRSVKSVVAGKFHTCALLDNDRLKCWGSARDGGLGLESSENKGISPGQMGDALPYVEFGAGRTVKALSAGNPGCVVLDNNRVKCWGPNGVGQLGLGIPYSLGDRPNEMGDLLAYVDLGTSGIVKSLVADTCALFVDGRAKCWGLNTFGELGTGDVLDRGGRSADMGDALPFVDVGTGRSIVALRSSGSNMRCALLDNGRVKCWGDNFAGRLGIGRVGPVTPRNFSVGDQPGEMGDALPYVDVGSGRTVLDISGLGAHTCALLDRGDVKCWGSNFNGALGTGDSLDRGEAVSDMGDMLPTVNLGAGKFATAIGAGGTFTCAILSDRTVKCWGLNDAGQLGSGDLVPRGSSPATLGNSLLPLELGTN